MNHQSNENHIIRDILLLFALFFLGNIAFNRTISFIVAHKDSLIHELDRSFIDQLSTAQRLVHRLEQNIQNDQELQEVNRIKSTITAIEEKYKKNTPALALLGPIGTASIVIKEQQLQEKLLKAVNDIGKLIHHISHNESEFIPFESIEIGLAKSGSALKVTLFS